MKNKLSIQEHYASKKKLYELNQYIRQGKLTKEEGKRLLTEWWFKYQGQRAVKRLS